MTDLAVIIGRLFALGELGEEREAALAAFAELRHQLNAGAVRATEPWVKQGILLGFRAGAMRGETAADPKPGVRVVPGGTSIRDGAYVAPGVVIMPPAFINIGAYVDEGTMIDSHALVGSCAQIGRRVHISAAAQIGGVLEPVNATPVIIEDDAVVGGNCGVYEGAHIGARAVLGAGVILTRSTPVYDLVNGAIIRAAAATPLRIPPGAVVVPGSRAITHGRGPEWGLSLATPVIVKYRDATTDAATALESALR